MENKKQLIPIFFATNDNYAKYLDVALCSLIKNASRNYNYVINILYNDLSEKNIEALKKHEDENFTLTFTDVNETIKPIIKDLPDKFYFSISSYHRIFIEKLFPQFDKAIYLDCDLVVTGDISKLYETELGDNLLGVVNEQNCFLNPLFNTYINVVTGIDDHKYFNSGVLLLNLEAIRKFNLQDKFIKVLTTYNFESPMVDQDYLNNICRDKTVLLENGWNYEGVPGIELEGKLNIRHYALTGKPWRNKEIPDAQLFWDYAKSSKFYDELVSDFESITPEMLQKEMEMMGGFIALAQRLIESDYTFKKVIVDNNIRF